MRMVLTAVAASVLMACSPQQSAEQAQEPQTEQQAQQESAKMQYPETRKGDVVDTYFETEIADPYRWLEDDRSEETENWVKAQNEVTFDHLENIPFREKIEARLTEL